jgi:hypothetical protein
LPFWSFFGSGSFDTVTCLPVVSTYSFMSADSLPSRSALVLYRTDLT